MAIALFTEIGRFNRVGKLHEEVGETFEEDMNTEAAIENYQKAVEAYSGEEMTAACNRMNAKIAVLLASQARYPEAADLFRQLGTSYVTKELTKYGAKKMFLNSALCTLARGDVIGAKANTARFKDIDFMFADSPEV